MPSLKSYADILHDWEKLLEAANDNAADLAVAEPQRAALQKTLAEVRVAKSLQDSYKAHRQQMTQEIKTLLEQGREEARRLRGMAKGLLGTKNERLVQFEVAPLRKRARVGAGRVVKMAAGE